MSREEEAALAALERRAELHRRAGGGLGAPDALTARRADLGVEARARRVEARIEQRGGRDRFGTVGIRGGDQRHHLRVEHFAQAAFGRIAGTACRAGRP